MFSKEEIVVSCVMFCYCCIFVILNQSVVDILNQSVVSPWVTGETKYGPLPTGNKTLSKVGSPFDCAELSSLQSRPVIIGTLSPMSHVKRVPRSLNV